ncbi:hypothetical protein [Profundibacter sp.]
MASGPDTRLVKIDPSDLGWNTPAQARRRLDGFAMVVKTDPLGSGKPVPDNRRLRILARLLDHLLPDGTTEHLPQSAESLDAKDRRYLANLIHHSRLALDKRQRLAPSTMLGFPDDTRGMWANLLDQGWVVWQPDWRGVLRK